MKKLSLLSALLCASLFTFADAPVNYALASNGSSAEASSGNAARIDVDYTVGASNGETTGVADQFMQPAVRKVMLNGVLYIEKNGVRYNVSGIQF